MHNFRGPFQRIDTNKVDCEIEHPVFGWVPFTADMHDLEPKGREVFAAIERGKPDIQPPPNRPVPRPFVRGGELDGLGRIPSVPSRNAEFPLSAPPKARTFRNWLVPGGPWDQGPTPHCVAYAGLGLLTAHPISNAQMHAETLYKLCQQQDQWPGEDYDGTSVLGLMRVFKARGFISEYRWTNSADVVLAHVLERGPVVIGVNWHRDMFTPTSDGYITPTGPVEGGHAVLVVGGNFERRQRDGTIIPKRERILSSWGGRWGQGGRVWIRHEHLDQLLKNGGEAAAATEVQA